MTSTDMRPYAETARDYQAAGWAPLPLPYGEKSPPPDNYTGRSPDPTPERVDMWVLKQGGGNICLRLPETVLGIDVDAYHGGADTLRREETRLGALPPTAASTSRTDGSGIRLYRVPAGRHWARVGKGIDTIQRAHRYVVAAPSRHPEGRDYRWVNTATGEPLDSLPKVPDLPELPDAWVHDLSQPAGEVTESRDLAPREVKSWLGQLPTGGPCLDVTDALARRLDSFAPGGRYDAMVAGTWELVSLGADGHRGVVDALQELGKSYVGELSGERPGAAVEFRRSLIGAVQQHDAPLTACTCGVDWVLSGDSFLLDESEVMPVIWGPSDSPLWNVGESLMFVGPPSVGKSTLAQLLALARMGLREDVLGYPVKSDGGRVLYLAMDRPAQIRRMLRRMVTEDDRDVLASRLLVRKGPLPRNITQEPYRDWLADECKKYGVTTIIVDSVKDCVPNPSDENAAGGYNLARQVALARGIQWIEVHHNRKASDGNRRPKALDDVYGNRWLTAGAGSVVSLWAEPGDQEIELSQLKPLGDRHYPMSLVLDGATGEFENQGHVDPIMSTLLLADHPLTVDEIVSAMHGAGATKSNRESIRRQLNRMAERGEIKAIRERKTTRYAMA